MLANRRALTFMILLGLVGGAIAGQLMHNPDADALYRMSGGVDNPKETFTALCKFVGSDVFMGLLKMLIVPLIISSVIVGVTSVGDFRHLGGIGLKTLVYYFGTMLVAVVIGLVLVNIIKPGEGYFSGEEGARQRAAFEGEGQEKQREVAFKQQQAGKEVKTSLDAFLNIVRQMIPNNPVDAAAKGQALPIIVFSILFGIVLTTVGSAGRVVVQFFKGVMEVMIRMTGWVLWFAPVGVFCLVAKNVSQVGLGVFAEKIGTYMATVLGGLGIHAFIVLPLLLLVLGRTNPIRFFLEVRAALLTALSTASSSATLPVSMVTATKFGKCSKRAAGFVLPLGSTINMDGTALYEAVAVVFMAQAFSPVPLNMEQMVLIAITATLAAVGAAGIPEAGLTTMFLVVAAVNTGGAVGFEIPLGAIGILLAVDRILDMCRTSINVWGDHVGAKIISISEPDPPEEAEAEPV